MFVCVFVCVCLHAVPLSLFLQFDAAQSVGDFSSRIAMRCRDLKLPQPPLRIVIPMRQGNAAVPVPAVSAAAGKAKAPIAPAVITPGADTLALVYLEFATPAACQAAVAVWHKSKFLGDRIVVAISCSAAEIAAAASRA